jgi:hypothetical protein
MSDLPQEVLYAARWWRDQLVLSPLVSVDIATRFEQVFVQNFWNEKLASVNIGSRRALYVHKRLG